MAYLLEHGEVVQVSELVINLDCGVLSRRQAIEYQQLLVDRFQELVIERRRVRVWMMLGRLLLQWRKPVRRLVFVPFRAGSPEVPRLLRP